MFNPNKTISLIKGGVLDTETTWQSYLSENKDWKDTFTLLTGPMILASVILSAILGWLFSSFSPFGSQGGFGFTLLRLIGAVIGILVASFIFSFLAGSFKGKQSFNKGVAALSLAAIPAYLGGIFSTLPFIGWLIGLALGILSLVFLYKIIPSYLEVPEDKRVIHFIVSLIASFVLMLIINLILGLGAYQSGAFDNARQQDTSSQKPSMFGELGRQTDLIEKAENDRFKAPTDGKITEQQMGRLIIALAKTAEYQKDQEDKLIALDKQMTDKKDFSFADLGKLTSGISSAMSTANAEMEVVKTGGGNWAEHQWIKQQLHIAKIQKNINDSVKHNFALYEKYKSQLSEL